LDNHCFHVITGASGGGKSTLVAALKDLGYSIIPEAALAIMREQLKCNGKALPSVDRVAFMEAVLARSIQDYEIAQSLKSPVFFDRGIPEWLRFLGTNVLPSSIAATRCRYSGTVFVVEPWPEIYVCDHYRQHCFERAAKSFEPTVSAYIEAGYMACVIPKGSVQERVEFILAQIETGARQGAPADRPTAAQLVGG
jgi:predicted ATPase